MGWYRQSTMRREMYGNRTGQYAQNLYVKKVVDMKTVPGCRLVPLTDEGLPDLLSACAYSSGGSTHKPLLAVGGESGHLFVYKESSSIPYTTTELSPEELATKGIPQKSLPVHRGLVFDVSWAGNSHVLSAGGDSTVKLTDVETGTSSTFNGHKGSVRSCRFQQDSSSIFVSCSRDGAIALWDTRVASAKGSNVQPTRIISDAHTTNMRTASAQSACGAFFAGTSQVIVSAGVDGLIKLWDARTSHKARTSGYETCMGYIPHYGEGVRPRAYTSLAISQRDGDTVVANCLDQRLYVFELSRSVRYTHSSPDTERRHTAQREDGPINILAGHGFSSFYSKANINCDDSLVACGGRQGQVYLYQLRGANNPIAVLENGHPTDASGECAVDGIAWNPDDPFHMAVCSDEGYVRVWSTSDRGSAPVTSHRAGYEASGGDVVVGGSGYDSNGNVKYDIRDKMSARQKYSEKDWKARTRSENSAKRRSKQLDSPRSLSCGGSPGSDNVFIRTDTGKATHVLAECDALNAAKLRDDSIVYAIASGNLARRMYWKKDKSSCTCAAPTQQGISIPINMPTHTRKIVVPSDTPLACSKLHVSVAGRISERSECKRGKPIESRPHTSTRTSAVSTQTDNGQPAECVSTQVRHHVTGGQNANACQEGTVAHTPTPKQCRGDSQVDRRRISKSLTPTVTTPAHADTTETAAKMSGISGTKKTRSTLKASGATLHQLAEGSTIEMRVESGKEVWERTRVHINAIPFRKSKANRDIRSFFQPLQSAACKPQAASTVGDENKPPSNGTKLIARTRKGARLSVSKHNCTGKAADDERKRITPLAASTRLNSGSCTKTASIAKLNGKSKIAATKGPENRGGDIQTHLPTHTRPVLAVPRQKAGRKLGDTDDSYVSSCKRMKTSGNEAVDTQQTMNPVDAWFYPVQ